MLESIFKRLVDYTVYHFSMEENIMNEINYPKVEEHSNAHEEFISKIYHCEHNSETGNLLTSISLLDYLKPGLSVIFLVRIKNLEQFKKMTLYCSRIPIISNYKINFKEYFYFKV